MFSEWRASRSNHIMVYNCSSGTVNPITWGELKQYAMQAWMKYPTEGMMWYPSASYDLNPFVFKTKVWLYHYIPAYLYDLVGRAFRKKPMLVFGLLPTLIIRC